MLNSYSCSILAPSSPRNLTAKPWNATAVSVTWIIPAKPYGQITLYEIQYNAVGSNDVTSKVLLANELQELEALIDSLKAFTSYQLRIRAATLEGMWGNFSSVAEAITLESGTPASRYFLRSGWDYVLVYNNVISYCYFHSLFSFIVTLCLFTVFLAAPSVAPKEVQLQALSSDSILVHWKVN